MLVSGFEKIAVLIEDGRPESVSKAALLSGAVGASFGAAHTYGKTLLNGGEHKAGTLVHALDSNPIKAGLAIGIALGAAGAMYRNKRRRKQNPQY